MRATSTDKIIKDIATAVKHSDVSGSNLDRLTEKWHAYKIDVEITEDMFVESRTEDTIKYKDIDVYWSSVSKLTKLEGDAKYPFLLKVVRVVL